jgi:pilus assembly protein CpaC
MRFKLTHLLLSFPALAAACWQAAAADVDKPIALAVGAQKEIVVEKGLERLAIGDPGVADALILRAGPDGSGARVLVVGKAPGRTALMVWPKGGKVAVSYAIQVSGAGASLLMEESGQARIETRGKTVVLDGQIPDMARHGGLLAAAGESEGKPVVLDRTQVGVRSNTVQVDVKVVEFSKSVLKQAGFNIATNRNGFGFGVFAPGGLKSYAGGGSLGAIGFTTGSPLTQAFNLVFSSSRSGIVTNLGILESNGLARVLAEPTLVALSGQSASFLAGGEIPVPVPQSLGTVSIQYKPFGIGLMLTPTVLSDERIALKVAPEASDLDFTNAVTINGISVPAITTRRADTMVELADGESFVIGGLVSRSTLSDIDKVPLLGDIPILGAFFKRQSYQQNEKELVIVVTPHLIKPLPKGTDLQPLLPGGAEKRDAPVWGAYLAGGLSKDALPGFSN